MNNNLTPIASAVALLVMSASAYAQQADTTKADGQKAQATSQVQEVVVTGIRASLQQSINQKRNAEAAVEVITAEDVGKMPDKNVADSLQRLPGVNVATAGGTEGGFGENDRVALKGTPSAYALTTLNGHGVSSGDWYSLNISGGGRSVSYSLLPSELISTVTVYKTSQANLIEGGASGTVNIETRKPLDAKQQLTLQASVEGAYYSNSGSTQPQVSALVNWKNDENTFGVLAQAFDEKRKIKRDGQEFLWWGTMSSVLGANSSFLATNPSLAGASASWLTSTSQFLQDRETQGGLLDFQFKPNAQFSADLSLFYSRLNATNTNYAMMFAPYSAMTNGWSANNAGGINPSSWTVTGNTVTSLTMPACATGQNCSNMSSTVQDIAVRPGAHSDSAFEDFSFKYKANDKLTFDGKAGQTQGKGYTTDIGYEVWNGYTGGSYSLYGTSQPGSVVVPGAGSLTLRGSSPIGGWASQVTSTDKETYGQLDGTYHTDFDVIPTINFGARLTSHTRSLEDLNGTVANGGYNPSNLPNGLTTLASSLPNVLNNTWSLSPTSVSNWANQFVSFNTHSYQSEFNIKEDTQALYAMANYSVDRVSGNFGLRVVNTKEHVENGSPNTKWAPIISDNSYVDILPSANFRVEVSKDVVARFALSRTMARPDFGELASLTLLDTQQTGSGGNPNLKPIRSNNVDASVEWYFKPKSMLSVGFFDMNMESYVTYASYNAVYFNNSQHAYTTYAMSAAENTTAEVRGLELAAVYDLGNGFGINGNYTYADGQETGKAPGSACATSGDCSMIGTSKNSYNIGAFYENAKFSARIQYAYRSTYLNGLDRNSAIYQQGVGTLGLSLAYAVTPNLSVTLEGKDLNDPELISYAKTPDQPSAFYKNGRQLFFGIRGKL